MDNELRFYSALCGAYGITLLMIARNLDKYLTIEGNTPDRLLGGVGRHRRQGTSPSDEHEQPRYEHATGRRRLGDRARKMVKLPVMPNFKKAGEVSVVLNVEGIGAMSTSGGGTIDMKKTPILKRARFF